MTQRRLANQWRFKIYWEWVLESTDEKGTESNRRSSIERRILSKFSYYPLLSQSLTNEIKRDLFFWCYGDAYDPERRFPMPLGPDNWQPKLNMDVDLICQRLAGIIRRYIWGYSGDHEKSLNGKYFIDYFLSIYPYMNKKCFDLKRCEDQNYKENDVLVNLRGYQLTNRWFLAGLNNILTIIEEDEEISELPIHDHEALAYLKEGLKRINMPKEFYALEEFVIEHGEGCVDATID